MNSVRKRNPRVLVVGARGIPNVEGGAEKNAEKIFPRLVRAGYDVTLIALNSKTNSDTFEGVRLIGTKEIGFLKTEKLICYLSSVFYSLKFRPDIVHMQGLGAAILLPVFKVLGFKTVARYGSADYLVGKWGIVGRTLFRLCERNLLSADAVISVTPALSNRLARRGATKNVHFIPNALDEINEADHTLAPDSIPERPFFIAVGRVTHQKNVDTLIKSFNIFSKQHRDYQLLVVGGLDDAAYVETLKPIISGNVTLTGRMDRAMVLKLLGRCAGYINLSHHEGNSNATLEAISVGTPIVVSNIPENIDLDLPRSVYVDKDDPEAIADKLSQLLGDPASFKIEKGRFLAWDDVASKTGEIYRQLLGARFATHPGRRPPDV